jgi:hypothetical protein
VEDCITYDIDIYGGCSRAIVFLLDEHQPDSVGPHEFVRAIAVHSGPISDQEDANLGFLLMD